ncbi:MAG: Verru_Chthon cassette protein B [Chthoniobacteraceae bacterium]
MKTPLFFKSHLGFTLVEVALALGICTFCLVPLVGLIPVGLNSNRSSIEVTAGASLAASIVADLKTASPSSGTADVASPRLAIVIPGTPGTTQSHTLYFDQNGEITGHLDTDADLSKNPRYRATLKFITPEGSAASAQKMATFVQVLITWPAASDGAAATAPKNYSGSYETVISLDRG